MEGKMSLPTIHTPTLNIKTAKFGVGTTDGKPILVCIGELTYRHRTGHYQLGHDYAYVQLECGNDSVELCNRLSASAAKDLLESTDLMGWRDIVRLLLSQFDYDLAMDPYTVHNEPGCGFATI